MEVKQNVRLSLYFANALAFLLWVGSHLVTDSHCSLQRISPVKLLRYVHWSNRSSCRVVHDFGGFVTDYQVGCLDGQKSICMDPQVRPVANNCLVYSFGINYEWSFDEDFDAYGCQVYAFDPSMMAAAHDHSARIHFADLGIGVRDGRDPQTDWRLKDLHSIYQELTSRHGNVAIDVLKMDVEHAEWVTLPQMMSSRMLDRVRQLTLELHFLETDYSADQVRRYLDVVKALEDYGMVRFSNRPGIVPGVRRLLGLASFVTFDVSFYNSKLVPL